MSKYDFIVVGAGLTGLVIARELSDSGARCLIVEKRNRIGGNVSGEVVDGVRVHSHGPHIFHTNSKRIWEYIHKFSNWLPYEHRVKAIFENKAYSFPPNLLTFQQLGISPDDPKLQRVIYDTFFRGYSFKQWGKNVDSVPPSVIKRIPVRYNYDDRYFDDRYQGLPSDGYNKFVENIASGINFDVGVDYLNNEVELKKLADKVIYTGMIDALYNYKFGALEYRSLEFKTSVREDDCFGSPSLNFTDFSPKYTRVHNWRYFGYQPTKKNVVTFEYPVAHNGKNEPYYPVNNTENNEKYKKYKHLADEDGVIVAGRLGRYQYYNMDQAIGSAMKLSQELLKNA